MSHNLCKEYPALSPFEVDDMSYSDVIDLYSDIRTMQISDNKKSKKKETGKKIYVPAGDDWY